MTPPLRVGIWCAVSSQPQAEKISLEDQLDVGHKFTEGIGGQVVATYRVAHTRDYVFWHEAEAEMPAYRQLREDLEAGRLDVVHCVDSDRLGRDPALITQFESLSLRHSCEVYKASTPHPIGQQSAGHRYLSAFQAVRAGEDQALRVHRLRMGMKGRIKRGLLPGRIPYGYEAVRNDAGQVVEYAQTHNAEGVRYMTRFFLEGLSYSEIRRRMDASGYPAPTGGRWRWGAVKWTLHNDAYGGLPQWGSWKAEEVSTHYAPIWDRETFAAVVRERQRRARGKYHRLGASPLAGVVFCARCGSWMSRSARPDGRVYLRCNQHARKSRTGEKCHANYIREPEVIDAVAGFLRDNITDEAIDEAMESWKRSADQQAVDADLARARRLVDSLTKQRDRLALALAAGKMDVDIYHRADRELVGLLDAEVRRVQELEAYLGSLPDWEARRSALLALSRDFPRMVEIGEPAAVSRALQESGLVVLVEDGRVVQVGPV